MHGPRPERSKSRLCLSTEPEKWSSGFLVQHLDLSESDFLAYPRAEGLHEGLLGCKLARQVLELILKFSDSLSLGGGKELAQERFAAGAAFDLIDFSDVHAQAEDHANVCALVIRIQNFAVLPQTSIQILIS